MFKKLVIAGVFMSSFGAAQASDHGCTVLLCMANPGGWSQIGECVPPMKKLFKDLAKGKPFPACTFKSADGVDTGPSSQNYAKNQKATKFFCPADYLIGDEDMPQYCAFKGAVTVYVNGEAVNRVWWDKNGGSFVETPQ